MEDDDTIELQLSTEEMEALLRAAAPLASSLLPSPSSSDPLPAPVQSFDRQVRALRVPAIVSVAVFAISLGGFKYATTAREQEVPLAPLPISVANASETPQPTFTDAAPVRFTNPFDHSEVFDFPPGTSEAEARAQVAELLLQRASDRRGVPRTH